MLTELKCRKAVPRDKAYKLADEKGLFLFVSPKGFRGWRFKYRWQGKEKQLTFGAWPEVSLAEARERRDTARRQLRDGKDPGTQPIERETPTLRVASQRWLALQADVWKPKHAQDVKKSLEDEVYPVLGARPIDAVTSAEVLDLPRR